MQETLETRVWSLGPEDPLEEDMATHSRILAFRLPETEETGVLFQGIFQTRILEWVAISFSRESSQPKG